MTQVDAREIDQPGGGDEELASPYVEGEELDLHRWAHDAFALALPAAGALPPGLPRAVPATAARTSTSEPDHAHEPAPDPRWAKLGELKFD